MCVYACAGSLYLPVRAFGDGGRGLAWIRSDLYENMKGG